MNKYLILGLFTILITIISCKKEDVDSNPNRLSINESKTLSVKSAERWNDAEIEVLTGETYHIVSTGTWTDLTYETDADGFSDPVLDAFSHLKRSPDAKWFELIAAVDTTTLYIAGSDTTITFNEDGSLSFFANDADGFYNNNTGSINTTVTRSE